MTYIWVLRWWRIFFISTFDWYLCIKLVIDDWGLSLLLIFVYSTGNLYLSAQMVTDFCFVFYFGAIFVDSASDFLLSVDLVTDICVFHWWLIFAYSDGDQYLCSIFVFSTSDWYLCIQLVTYYWVLSWWLIFVYSAGDWYLCIRLEYTMSVPILGMAGHDLMDVLCT